MKREGARAPAATGALPGRLHLAGSLGERVGSGGTGDPAVPVARGAFERSTHGSAQQHGRALTVHRGRADRAGDALPLSAPDPSHLLELAVEHLPAGLEIEAARLEVVWAQADPEAENEAPLREVVDGGGLLGEER